MPQAWKTIRVFISSTFRDMHHERDRLVRFVFPELRERCSRRRLHLVDVDLRWGVTEEEAEQGRVLDVCLGEIERCRPFFIGLLGERYGWVPAQYAIADEARYEWIRALPPGQSITALEVYHGVLRDTTMRAQSFFYFRDPDYSTRVPKGERAEYQAESEESAHKLARLKTAIRDSGLPVRNYESPDESFGRLVLDDLWGAIDQAYPATLAQTDELSGERAYHEAFAENRGRSLIGRDQVLEAMYAYADGSDAAPLLITGESGSGKSALLANFALGYAAKHPECFVLTHFIGASPGSTSLRSTLLRVCRELMARFSMETDLSGDASRLVAQFGELLEEAGRSGTKVVLVIDALDQLEGGAPAWLPSRLPPNIRLLESAIEDTRKPAGGHAALPLIRITELDRNAARELAEGRLWTYRKRLSSGQMDALLAKPCARSPLFLTVACEELRVFGAYERVGDRIQGLPADIGELFAQVLERLEADHGRALVTDVLSLVACSREGLLEMEILELLAREGELQLPRAVWAPLYRGLGLYLRPPGDAGEGTLGFFHQHLASAVRHRYLDDPDTRATYHRRLAQYFREKCDPGTRAEWRGGYERALNEVAWQYALGKMWPELEATLTDFGYLEARAKAGTIHEVIPECQYASEALPEKLRGGVAAVREALLQHAHKLARYPEITNIQVFNHLLSSPGAAGVLSRIPCERRPVLQAAWPLHQPDAEGCSAVIRSGSGKICCADASPDGNAVALGISAPGQRLKCGWIEVFGSPSWNRVARWEVFDPHVLDPVSSVRFSPDGQLIAAGASSGALAVFDRGGHRLHYEDGLAEVAEAPPTWLRRAPARQERGPVVSICWAPDGKRIAVTRSSQPGGSMEVIETASWKVEWRVRLGNTDRMGLHWLRSGRILVCSGLKVLAYDATTGKEEASLGTCGFFLAVNREETLLAISGPMLDGGKRRPEFQVWDLRNWTQAAALPQLAKDIAVRRCCFAPGRDVLAVSYWDGSIEFWDVSDLQKPVKESGPLGAGPIWCWRDDPAGFVCATPESAYLQQGLELSKTRAELPRHAGPVSCVDISPDGAWIASGSWVDRKVLIWPAARKEISDAQRVLPGTNKTEVNDVRWSADGKRLAVVTRSGGFVYDVDQGHLGGRSAMGNDDLEAAAWSPGDQLLAVCGCLGHVSFHRTGLSGSSRALWPDPEQNVPERMQAVAWSRNNALAAGGRDGKIRLWQVEVGRSLATGVLVWQFDDRGWIEGLDWFADGLRLAAVTSSGGLRVWRAFEQEPQWRLEEDHFTCCRVLPDQQHIVCGATGGWISIYEVGAGLKARYLTDGSVEAVAASRDGRQIAAGCYDGSVTLWDVRL